MRKLSNLHVYLCVCVRFVLKLSRPYVQKRRGSLGHESSGKLLLSVPSPSEGLIGSNQGPFVGSHPFADAMQRRVPDPMAASAHP